MNKKSTTFGDDIFWICKEIFIGNILKKFSRVDTTSFEQEEEVLKKSMIVLVRGN